MKYYNEFIKIYNKINDPLAIYQWGLRYLNFDEFYDQIPFSALNNVTVAIIDSGIDKDHEDLKEYILNGFNLINNTDDTTDNLGHGTAIAGIIGAKKNNNVGIAGIASGVNILPIKIIDSYNEKIPELLIEAISYAIDRKVDVINISLGHMNNGLKNYDFHYLKIIADESKIIDKAIQCGIIVVAAIGNSFLDLPDYPSAFYNVISVGSYGILRKNNSIYISPNNNKSFKTTIYAPGEYIYSTLPNNTYGYNSGSSLATAFVTGTIAVIKAINPEIQFDEVIRLLFKKAYNLKAKNNSINYRLLNVDAMVKIMWRKHE